MGADKVATKSGGFFHLFDWNRKSRKKLFVSPEGTKQERKTDGSLPATRLRLNDEDDVIGGDSSIKGSSDYSCASSVTDEEGNGIKAPGVVARLMGLDSLPNTGVSEPFSTPLYEPQYIRDNRYQKRSPDFEVNDQFTNKAGRTDVYSRKPPELKRQKTPSSPIERFQTEMLPPRSAKSLPITHYKLLSPIKNPRFISSENAAHIMEAAVRILEPGLQVNSNARVPSVGSSLIPLKICDPNEQFADSQRTSRFLESSTKPSESNAMKYLRGQPLNKSWNGSESDGSFRASPDRAEVNSIGSRSKGKSISLAIQAKVNVQRREGLSTSSRNSLIQKEQDDSKTSQSSSNWPSIQKSKLQKKASLPSTSGVLKQNNQKQNCLANKDKVPVKPQVTGLQGRKVVSSSASTGRSKSLNKPLGNSKCRHSKADVRTVNVEKEKPSSRTNNFPRKRSIDRDYQSERSGCDGVLVGRHEKRLQPNVLIDEHPKWGEDSRKNGMDVVSFTFTSPIMKSLPGSQPCAKVMEKQATGDAYYADTHWEKNDVDAKSKTLSTLGLNVISGDSLSILLEQKIRELMLDLESSNSSQVDAACEKTPGSSVQDLLSDSETATVAATPMEYEKNLPWGLYKDNHITASDSGFSSINGQVFNMSHNLQAESLTECSSSSDARKEPDNQHRSPFSVLEATFSNESFNYLDEIPCGSWACSSIQVQGSCGSNPIKEGPSLEADNELSDSASSSFTEAVDGVEADRITRTGHMKTRHQEMGYVKEILSAAELNAKGSVFGYASETLDPLLFDQLEKSRNDNDKNSRLKRKLLFDCMSECLDAKFGIYFHAGYRSWTKGVALVEKGDVAEEVYKEISGWRGRGDWMVDELVDKDMSSHLGRWLDFETDAFEIGIEIEDKILVSLIYEMIADFLV